MMGENLGLVADTSESRGCKIGGNFPAEQEDDQVGTDPGEKRRKLPFFKFPPMSGAAEFAANLLVPALKNFHTQLSVLLAGLCFLEFVG